MIFIKGMALKRCDRQPAMKENPLEGLKKIKLVVVRVSSLYLIILNKCLSFHDLKLFVDVGV